MVDKVLESDEKWRKGETDLFLWFLDVNGSPDALIYTELVFFILSVVKIHI